MLGDCKALIGQRFKQIGRPEDRIWLVRRNQTPAA
jgi:hypothetical protein